VVFCVGTEQQEIKIQGNFCRWMVPLLLAHTTTSHKAQGQNANLVGAPNAGSLSLIQSAGTKRRHKRVHRTKKRRGGFLGQVINQAIVPFTLLGMQQKYRRNKSNHSSTKSRRRYK
jgi:hypothetical protein